MSRGTAQMLRESATTLAGVITSEHLLAPTLTIRGQPQTVAADRVSPDYFGVLGLQPLIGRLFVREPANGRGIVISERRWRQDFDASESAIGARVTLDDDEYTIVGVLGNSAADALGADLWIRADDLAEPEAYVSIAVRLEPGADKGAATAQITSIVNRANIVRGSSHAATVRLSSLGEGSRQLRDYHVALSGAALVVLLIACANIATLLLSRGISRRQEMALRAAVGASRGRLVQQLLGEYTAIAAIGGVTGLALAAAGIEMAQRAMPASLQSVLVYPQMSWRVFGLGFPAFAAALFGFGLWPALRTTDVELTEILKDGAATTTSRHSLGQGALVAVEFAFAVVLVVASGLLARTVYSLSTFDFGYRMDGVVSTQVVPADAISRIVRAREAGDKATVRRIQVEAGLTSSAALVAATRSPGIQVAASMIGRRPTDGVLTIDDGQRQEAQPEFQLVTADFLRVLRVRVVQGRDFSPTDQGPVAVIDERVAARLWPGRSAIGRSFKTGPSHEPSAWITVIGVTRPVYLKLPSDLDIAPPSLIAVLTDSSARMPGAFVMARGRADAQVVASELTRALHRELPTAVTTEIIPWAAPFRTAIDRQEFLASLFVVLGSIGVFLAAFGLYGTVSYVVRDRRREYAVRMALGAAPADVMTIVIRTAAMMVLAGAGIGAGLAMWASRFLDSVLYGVFQIDAPTLIGAELILFSVVATAAYLPARRATHTNPLDALRS
jgi:putative ABC transport system permease protein